MVLVFCEISCNWNNWLGSRDILKCKLPHPFDQQQHPSWGKEPIHVTSLEEILDRYVLETRNTPSWKWKIRPSNRILTFQRNAILLSHFPLPWKPGEVVLLYAKNRAHQLPPPVMVETNRLFTGWNLWTSSLAVRFTKKTARRKSQQFLVVKNQFSARAWGC